MFVGRRTISCFGVGKVGVLNAWENSVGKWLYMGTRDLWYRRREWFFNFRSVYSSGGYVRYLGITEWVGIAESAACLTDVTKVWAACSKSVVEDEEGWVGMERSRMDRKRGQFVCL